MKNLFLSKKSKLIIDSLLIVVLVLMLVHMKPTAGLSWMSYHCVMGIVFLVLMTIHTWQHWSFVKALPKKKVIRKNKITTLTTALFFLLFVSILLFATGFEMLFLKFHNIVGHVFMAVVIIHFICKFKQFTSLLFNKNR